MWLTVCHSQLPWPLSICICFSFYWYTLTNCPFHPCVTWPLSILLCERLNCFSYLADWVWLALLSLGSLTGWRGAAVYTIAGKLVNLKCPGIWWRFNVAFACLCSYVFCSAFSTNSQTLYKWKKRRFSAIITSAHLRGNSHQKIVGFLCSPCTEERLENLLQRVKPYQ